MPPPKSKLPACTNCRQHKLKCNSHENFPASCSRCEKHGLRCSVDPSFRRTAKRKQLASLENELERLKQGASRRSSIGSSSAAFRDTHIVASEGDRDPQPDYLPVEETQPSFDPVSDSWLFGVQRIDGVELDSTAIGEMLNDYYAHYHGNFPILAEKSAAFPDIQSCPLLFWTIIAVVTQRSTRYSHLHAQLIAPVHRMATDWTASISNPLLTVQALLLLCWWPLTLDSNLANPSWMHCGIATHTALQFGFHRPHFPSDFRYRESLSETAFVARRKTWLACFIVSQTLSSFVGVPCTIPVDHTILSAIGGTDLPKTLQQRLDIAYLNYQICQSLGQQQSIRSGLLQHPLTFVTMHDLELKKLTLQHEGTWTLITEIALLKAHLDLYAFICIAVFQKRKDAIQPTPSELKILIEASRRAERLIQIASPEDLHRWSTDVRTAVTFAAFFLLKLLAAYSELIDHTAAMNSVRAAWELFRQATQRKNDQYARVCSIIEYMSGVGGKDRAYQNSMSVTSRASSCIGYDTMWAARARFDQRIRAMRPLDYTLAAETEEASASASASASSAVAVAQMLPVSAWPELEEDFIASLVGSDLLGWEYAFEGL